MLDIDTYAGHANSVKHLCGVCQEHWLLRQAYQQYQTSVSDMSRLPDTDLNTATMFNIDEEHVNNVRH